MLDKLPKDILRKIYYNKLKMEFKEHKNNFKDCLEHINNNKCEYLFCSGCGKNVSYECSIYYLLKDLKTFVVLGENCCDNFEVNPEGNFRHYEGCYETLEEEDGEDSVSVLITEQQLQKYNLGWGDNFIYT